MSQLPMVCNSGYYSTARSPRKVPECHWDMFSQAASLKTSWSKTIFSIPIYKYRCLVNLSLSKVLFIGQSYIWLTCIFLLRSDLRQTSFKLILFTFVNIWVKILQLSEFTCVEGACVCKKCWLIYFSRNNLNANWTSLYLYVPGHNEFCIQIACLHLTG